MFDFIPLPLYTVIYHHLLFFVMMFILLSSFTSDINDYSKLNLFSTFGIILLIFITLYIGFRPVSGQYFGDMATYAKKYKIVSSGGTYPVKGDYLFNSFMVFCSKIMDYKFFFALVSICYILPCYWFSKKYFGSFWFYVFFMFVGSYSFWAYGTNGIRNGMATALFLLAICFYEKKLLMFAIMLLAYGFHNSLAIPITSFVVAMLIKNPKLYLMVWLLAIPLSLAGGGFWENFFNSLGLGEDRASGYLTDIEKYQNQFSQTGFRLDFVLYSCFAVFAGWYFIFKKKVTDKFYINLWGAYMISNAFWILVIGAAFSNRFAYLSWFLMAPVIAYPLLKYKIFLQQQKIIGWVVAAYYTFTYVMYVFTK